MESRTLATQIACWVCLVTPRIACSQVPLPAPKTIGFTGFLAEPSGQMKPDGQYLVALSLYNQPSGGNPLWSETKNVTVTHGLFSTALGDTTPFASSTMLTFDTALFVGVHFGSDPEMLPRLALQSVPYALFAHEVADASITDSKMVSVSYSKVIGAPLALPPTGAAGGDLSGAYPDPSVTALQSVPISPTRPSNGQVLTYSSTSGSWVPSMLGGNELTGLTATAPLVSTEGQVPNLSIPQASANTNGYLSSSDWSAFNGKVGSLGVGTGVSIGGTPIAPTVAVLYGVSSGTAAQGNDPRLSDQRSPTAGSNNYVQNGSTAQAANFYVTGNGTVGGNLGIGTASPLAGAKLDVRGEVVFGNGGKYYVAGSQEKLQLIEGQIDGHVDKGTGPGFTFSHVGTGKYQVNFVTPFTNVPSVTANVWLAGTDSLSHAYANLYSIAQDLCVITTYADGVAVDADMTFIAAGPR